MQTSDLIFGFSHQTIALIAMGGVAICCCFLKKLIVPLLRS